MLGGAVAGDAFGAGPERFAGGGEVGILGCRQRALVSRVEAEVAGQVQGAVADACWPDRAGVAYRS
jgi:hypothetical protein